MLSQAKWLTLRIAPEECRGYVTELLSLYSCITQRFQAVDRAGIAASIGVGISVERCAPVRVTPKASRHVSSEILLNPISSIKILGFCAVNDRKAHELDCHSRVR